MARFMVSGDADLLAIRFARSPAWETHEAARSLVGARSALYHARWRDLVHAGASGLELDALHAVSALDQGWVADFVTPPPPTSAPTLEEQLDEIRRTPPRQVLAELVRCRENQSTPARRATL